MSLETEMAALTAALEKNTAALLGKANSGASAGGKTSETKPDTAKGPKLTFDMVKAAVVEVKDLRGKPAAQAIIKNAGKAADLASIKPAQFEAVMKACEEAKAEEDAPADEEDSL
jgi:hypothetical protein